MANYNTCTVRCRVKLYTHMIKPPLFWFQVSVSVLEAACKDLLLFSHNSTSEVGRMAWLLVCTAIQVKGQSRKTASL